MSIGPVAGAVSIQLGPIALLPHQLRPSGATDVFAYIPGRGSVESIGYVMIAFTMSTHVEHLVLNMAAALTVQAKDLILESLPLSLFVVGVKFRIGIVCPVDKTKIHGGLTIE